MNKYNKSLFESITVKEENERLETEGNQRVK